MTTSQQQFDDQQFANDYQLVNGIAMHAGNPKNFHIPPDVFKMTIRTILVLFLFMASPCAAADMQWICAASDGTGRTPIVT